MVRGGLHVISAPGDIVVDSCSVRAKRGGDLVGPNPTDRGKPGTKYHVVVEADGLPLASAANVNDTQLLPHLLNRALVVCANLGRLIAPSRGCGAAAAGARDAGYHSADNRGLCLREGIQPAIRRKDGDHGSGLGAVRSIVEYVNAWLLSNKRLDRRHDRSAGVIQSLLTTACILVIANRLADL